MTFSDTLARLGTNTADMVEALWAKVPDELDQDEFVALAAIIIAASNRQGSVVAALALAEALGDRPTLPPADPARTDTDRLSAALETILTDPTYAGLAAAAATKAIRKRVRRLAHAEPIEAAQAGYGAGLQLRPAVIGWVRQVNPTACELCRAWDDGKVRPPSTTMLHHPGCTCTQKPVRETTP